MFENVLSKGYIGNVELRNRLVMPSMGSNRTEPGGLIGEELIEYYATRARGGFGLIITEYTGIDPGGLFSPNQLKIHSDEYIPGFKRLAGAIHAGGAKAFMQLFHGGRAAPSFVIGHPPVSPSVISAPGIDELLRELTNGEVYDLIGKFGDAALRAKKADYDGVELHGSHGYLIQQFMSASVNRRTDEFGGDILGRSRFATEVIKNVKQKCGADFPVIVRISGDEMFDGGMKLNETRVMGKILEKAGADAFNISAGAWGLLIYSIAPYTTPMGFNTYAAEEIKKSVKIPVIAVGRIADPAMADAVIEDGMADFIGLGRASLADPEFPNKLREGRADEISPCIGCMNGCLTAPDKERTQVRTECSVNAFSGHETYMKIEPANKLKTIVVVGGGVAGLEAAWISAARGHKVILFEKNGNPGGHAHTAGMPPGKQPYAAAIKYYITMCRKYGVDMRLSTEATADMVVSIAPDAVILGTGARPKELQIPNDGIAVAQAAEVLNGEIIPGSNVLVVGGSLIGLDTAVFLLSQLRSATVVEMLDQAGEELFETLHYSAFKTLRDGAVDVLTSTKVESFTKDGAVCSTPKGEVTLSGYDMVVLAVGSQPYNPLEKELEGRVPEIHVIGDAVYARRFREAVREGAEVALKI